MHIFHCFNIPFLATKRVHMKKKKTVQIFLKLTLRPENSPGSNRPHLTIQRMTQDTHKSLIITA